MVKKIEKSVDKIRDECDNIEKEIDAKRANTYGDPIVELF